MVIGLKRGVVELADHDPEWESLAVQMIDRLRRIFGATAKDIQHVGSTAIEGMKAKPIIDIAVGVQSLVDLDDVFIRLDKNGIVKSSAQPIPGDIVCAFKDRSVNEKYVVHIEEHESVQWRNHVEFRDYLNLFSKKANAYEALKISLAKLYPENQDAYLNGKREFIESTLNEARSYFMMRDKLDIRIFEPVEKGRSEDKKYYIETTKGQCMLLRITDVSDLDRKKAEYRMMERVFELGFITSQPFGFGLCNGGNSVYSLSDWLDREDAEPWGDWFYRIVQERIDFYIQWTDGVPYKLKSPFDFSFLSKYGKVFKVYDDQDSGNICFGVADDENKYFVKFAGAPTERSQISTVEAIDRMKSTVAIYQDLAHPLLTKLIYAEEIGGGFAMVFEWTDAECMGRQYPASREKFMQMPLDTRLRVFDDILAFHTHIAKQGYVAIDFYDGCIMYDFNTSRTILCDVELYAKIPYNNPIGRMWGSTRFMSPEEFELGAVIDEITNVYTMGATAFAFFGNERDRCFEQWVLSKELFDIAKQAVSDDRSQRQQSIEKFITEWKAAK
ncbi:MAG: GrpB family protein [Clostridiales bacterium]|nr:GrpB family protein [Clostridiales bacterium]